MTGDFQKAQYILAGFGIQIAGGFICQNDSGCCRQRTGKLKKYDAGKIDVARLLGFEENNVVTTIDIISQLHLNKDKYDVTKSFNQNLPIILNLDSDTVARTQEDKMEFIKFLVAMDKENKLSEYIWNGISVFNEIYENEMKLTI